MTKPTVLQASHLATVFIAGVLLGGVFLGGISGTASTQPSVEETGSIRADRCAGGTDVSAFVCRNTWMASTKFSTRY